VRTGSGSKYSAIMATMKRSFSLSELQDSLDHSSEASYSPIEGTLRRSKSTENLLKNVRGLAGSGAVPGTPTMPGSPSGAVAMHSSRAPVLSEKELREHFNMPLNEVAKKYGMCTTALKKLCRKYGVMQWPHRKLRSLEKKIASLKAEQRYTTDGQGHLDDEIRKLEQHREALVNGCADAGGDDNTGNWSPAPMSPPDDNPMDGVGGPGADSPRGRQHDSPRGLPRSGGKEGKASVNEEKMQQQLATLEEENASLRALSRSLMKERQELMSKQNQTGVELQQLRQTVEHLQMQLAIAGGGDAGRTAAMVSLSGSALLGHEDLDVKRKPQGPGPSPQFHPGSSNASDGTDMHALSWMAPDFELDELL